MDFIVFWSPDSPAAKAVAEFYGRANEAYKVAVSFYEEMPDDIAARDALAREFKEHRDGASAALDQLGREVSGIY